jgi:exoribonuclease-2
LPPSRSPLPRRSSLHPGDLVGLLESRGALLAVVEEVRSGKIALRIGWEGRRGTAPQRDLELIAALPDAAATVPVDPTAPPWSLQRDTLAQALPAKRELAAAWLLLRESLDPAGSALELAELADLLGDGGEPALRSALWLWLQGEQDWFRWRQQRAEPRPPEEIHQRRRQRHRQQLSDRRRRA